MAGGRLWTEDEERIVLDYFHALGPRALTERLPGRSALAIKHRAQVLQARGLSLRHDVSDPVPPWAVNEAAERLDNKAARVIVLYLRRRQLANIERQALADALGVHRTTLERYLAAMLADMRSAIEAIWAARMAAVAERG